MADVKNNVDKLHSSLGVAIKGALTFGREGSAITGKQKRMELVHSILSIGKVACGDVALLKEGWCEKEKAFMQILAGAQQ